MSFEIFPVSAAPGHIALSPMPGRYGPLARDIDTIATWGAELVLTMTGTSELLRSGAGSLGAGLRERGIAWRHLPILDFGAPDPATTAVWPVAAEDAHAILNAGGRVLTHCFGGCGRSGMAALRLLVERGEAPDTALARLRAARPCAVETEGQFRWAAAATP